jgi:Protein of unknown function (DUF3630)
MSKVIHSGYPRLETMASGQESIAIAQCSYDEFSDCAQFWAAKFDAQILQAIDGPDQRLLIIQIRQCMFWLAFDEFFNEICLEPQDPSAGKIIPSIYAVINGMKS